MTTGTPYIILQLHNNEIFKKQMINLKSLKPIYLFSLTHITSIFPISKRKASFHMCLFMHDEVQHIHGYKQNNASSTLHIFIEKHTNTHMQMKIDGL